MKNRISLALSFIVASAALAGCFGREGGAVCDDCTGCCTADGACVGGGTDGACGNGGDTCTDCGDGFRCDDVSGGGGECVADTDPPPACDPLTCDGCCTAEGVCVSGLTDAQCGNSAGSCVSCDTGSQCQAWQGGGHCVRLDDCTPFNCDGCCTETGACRSGTSDDACGDGGERCVPCEAPAFCEPTGIGGGICA